MTRRSYFFQASIGLLSLTDRTRAEAASRGFLQATRAPPLWREFFQRCPTTPSSRLMGFKWSAPF